jgi:hypothetical protein
VPPTSLARLLAAQRRYLGAETFYLSFLVRLVGAETFHLSFLIRLLRVETFRLNFLVRAGLGAGRRLWITAGVRQYGHLLPTPAHGGHVIVSLGLRLILRKSTFALPPAPWLTHPG